MKKIIVLFLLSAFVFKGFSQAGALPEPFAPQTVKAFADSLFLDGFLDEAEGEYRRSLFTGGSQNGLFALSEKEGEDAVLKLTSIYHTNKDKSGILWLDSNFINKVSVPLQEKIGIVEGGLLFLERDLENFSLFKEKINPLSQGFSPDFSNLLQISSLVLENQIQQAAEITKEAVLLNEVFAPLNNAFSAYKTKRPGLALFLSCLLPGIGKWYGGTFSGFVTDFLMVGSFAAGTVVTGIQSEWKDWRPYVFGSAGLILWIVDIYGSYQNAKRYNAAQYRVLCQETDKVYEEIF